jgi:transcriptional regulator with XRE-family HTH domain
MPKKGGHPIDQHVGSRLRMRRLMLGMSQTQLGDVLGITFRQVQKYEKGANRISASRLHRMSEILQVPVEFFFEGSPHPRGQHAAQTDTPSPQFVSDYLSTLDGLNLTKAFMHIRNAQLRRSIVNLVEAIAGPEENDGGAA